jgi:hypothetical protein
VNVVLYLNILGTYHQEQARKVSPERNASIAFALFFSLGVKFVNNFRTDTQYFNKHFKISPYLSSRLQSIIEITYAGIFTIRISWTSVYRILRSIMIDTRCSTLSSVVTLTSQVPQCLYYEHSFLSLSACPTGYILETPVIASDNVCTWIFLWILSCLFDFNQNVNVRRDCSKNSKFKISR